MKGEKLIYFVLAAGVCFGLGMWNSHKEDGFSAFLTAWWFALAALNIYNFTRA